MPLLGGVLLGGKKMPARSKAELKDLALKTMNQIYNLSVRRDNLVKKIAALKKQKETGVYQKFERSKRDKEKLGKLLEQISGMYGGRASRKGVKLGPRKVSRSSSIDEQIADAELKLAMVRAKLKSLNAYLKRLDNEANTGVRAVKYEQKPEAVAKRVAKLKGVKRPRKPKLLSDPSLDVVAQPSGAGVYKAYAKRMGGGPLSVGDVLRAGLDMYGGRKKSGRGLLESFGSVPSFKPRKGGAVSGGRKKKGLPPALQAWQQHLQNVRAENPHLSLKQAMQVASQSYRK